MSQGTIRKWKNALIIILQALIPYRDQAEWFLEIIKTTDNEELENKLINTIYQQVKTIKSTKDIENIKKNISEIHNKYEYKEEQDKKDAEKLLDDFIDNI
jgi:hypothetical protein